MLTEEEIQRAVEIGKRMGLEVSFGNKESGVFIEDKKIADLHEMFPEMCKENEWKKMVTSGKL